MKKRRRSAAVSAGCRTIITRVEDGSDDGPSDRVRADPDASGTPSNQSDAAAAGWAGSVGKWTNGKLHGGR